MKSPQGSDEIATRRHGLSMRVRQMLILVDGRRSIADLSRMVPEKEVLVHMEMLASQGFVMRAEAGALRHVGSDPDPADAATPPVARTWATVLPSVTGLPDTARPRASQGATTVPVAADLRAAAAAPSPSALPVQRRDLETVRRQIVRHLVDTVGPGGDDMAVRIERCCSVDEIRQLMPTVAGLVEAISGRAAMLAFVQRVGPV